MFLGIFPSQNSKPPSMALEEGLGGAHALLGQRWVIQLVPKGHTSAMIRDPPTPNVGSWYPAW